MQESNQLDNSTLFPEVPEYHIVASKSSSEPILSIIVTSFNSEKFIDRCLKSIHSQSIGLSSIELIVIDDGSTDSSLQISEKWAESFPSHQLILMGENTGSPGIPRNIGISLARGKYFSIVDSDDWLAENGMERLVSVLEASGDRYAAGKTVVVGDDGNKTIGRYYSNRFRQNASVDSIGPLYNHLAPTGRIIETNFVRENNIVFPNMKFSEDTIFYMMVLLNLSTISTCPDVVYYADRTTENGSSLTTRTTLFEKMRDKTLTLKHVVSLGLDVEREKQVLSRIFDLDFVTRVLKRRHFLKSEDKKSYFRIFDALFAAEGQLRYSVRELFLSELNYELYCLVRSKQYELVTKLVQWDFSKNKKQYFIASSQRFFESTPSGIRDFAVPVRAFVTSVTDFGRTATLTVAAYGDHERVSDLVLIDRNDPLREFVVSPVHQASQLVTYELDVDTLRNCIKGGGSMVLIYDDYKRIAIEAPAMLSSNFYFTVNDRIGFKRN